MGEFTVPVLLIVAGFIVLVGGGELLVRGASKLAAAMHISPLIVGLTVVAFCTSAPELAVVLQSSFADKADLAVANVVGSCICNILLVLGLAAVVAPLLVKARLVRYEVPMMVLASVLVLVFGRDGRIDRTDGWILFAGLIAYIIWTVLTALREKQEIRKELAERAETSPNGSFRSVLKSMALLLVGLGMLIVSSDWLVKGSIDIAKLLGVGERMIGLTILAIGTSLPETAICVIAAARGKTDLAVGNVVGSNIFNILCVLGFSAAVAPSGIAVSHASLWFDIPVMIAVSLACLPIFFTGHRIARWEGFMLVGYYIAYLAYLVFEATQSETGRTFATIMIAFVVPLTLVTLFVGVVRAIKSRHASDVS